jgi:hypothetical protein
MRRGWFFLGWKPVGLWEVVLGEGAKRDLHQGAHGQV